MKARGIFAVMAAMVAALTNNFKLSQRDSHTRHRRSMTHGRGHRGRSNPGAFGGKNAGVKLAKKWGR